MPKQQRQQSEYDTEPVKYCPRCFSLKIKYEDSVDTECCMDCGCSDIAETTIDMWERLYEKKYGHKFVSQDSNIRNSPVFKMSISKLREKVFNSSLWKKIAKTLYPSFPEGYSRADSIILLFDRLIKDNRLDDLRYLLLGIKK